METYDAIAKIVIVGDSSVGKTCLILRYTQDLFRESYMSTIGRRKLAARPFVSPRFVCLFVCFHGSGVDFKSKIVSVQNKRYKLQLWDTAGQERYNSLRRGFYRGAKVISQLTAIYM